MTKAATRLREELAEGLPAKQLPTEPPSSKVERVELHTEVWGCPVVIGTAADAKAGSGALRFLNERVRSIAVVSAP